jgi:hypothetical protein
MSGVQTGKGAWTPGPWRVEPKDGGTFNVVAGPDYFTRVFVAFMGADPEHGDIEANARLIATAPDLLEAATTALESLLAIRFALAGEVQENDPAIAKLEAAITRALGDQTR